MYAQCAYPYSARWELPVSCRRISKCTHYNDRISLLNLPTCTGQGILNTCFHILSCMMAEVTVFTQRGLCLCRNCQSVRHVGLLLMLLSRLSQLAALCHDETCQQEHNCVWRIQQLIFVVLLSAVCACALVCYKKVSFTGTKWWCTSWSIEPDAYQDCAMIGVIVNMSWTPYNALFRCVRCFVRCMT